MGEAMASRKWSGNLREMAQGTSETSIDSSFRDSVGTLVVGKY
jgi:hypothetical protein